MYVMLSADLGVEVGSRTDTHIVPFFCVLGMCCFLSPCMSLSCHVVTIYVNLSCMLQP